MAVVSVLKYEGDNKSFVWQHPCRDFNMGSQLIVHESQEAIFMANGEILDTFGPGRHTLETENLPVSKSLFKFGTGGRSPFHAELYFVNLAEQMAIKWGTDSKISYMDPEYNFPLEIGACGEMNLAVSNSAKLLIKVVGTEKALSQEKLTGFFRAFLMNRIKSIFPKVIEDKKINVFSIDKNLIEISETIETKIRDDFYDYGIDLRKFLITTVLKPDEDRNFIKFKEINYRKYTDIAEAELKQKVSVIEQQTRAQQTVIEAESLAKKRALEGYTYQQEKGFEVAKEIAKNEAVGQFSNLGVGLGMMAGIGSEVGHQVGSMTGDAMKSVTQPATSPKRFCMNCGHEMPLHARFCEQCGMKVEQQQPDKCVQCGYEFTNDAKFCPQCGTKRG